MKQKRLRTFSKLLLANGVNLQKNQNLLIVADRYHWDFVVMLTEEAYKMGARFVKTEVGDVRIGKARVDFAAEESLDYVPDIVKKSFDIHIKENWARLQILSPGEERILANTDKNRLVKMYTAMGKAAGKLKNACSSNTISWSLTALPNPEWAAKVFNCKPSKEAETRLWELLVKIHRLDEDDPEYHWKKHIEALETITKKINLREYKEIHLKSREGTDVMIGLSPFSKWIGGASYTPGGVRFLSNIPTEETFTTPDWRSVNGVIKCTRPVSILGSIVEDLWIKFRNGRIVGFNSKQGGNLFELFIKSDKGAARLGEIALVSCNSPIYKTGKVFNNALLDEHAGCHIALGAGIEETLKEPGNSGKAERVKTGFNNSNVHEDVVIGSETMEVAGKRDGNEWECIMKNGEFIL